MFVLFSSAIQDEDLAKSFISITCTKRYSYIFHAHEDFYQVVSPFSDLSQQFCFMFVDAITKVLHQGTRQSVRARIIKVTVRVTCFVKDKAKLISEKLSTSSSV